MASALVHFAAVKAGMIASWGKALVCLDVASRLPIICRFARDPKILSAVSVPVVGHDHLGLVQRVTVVAHCGGIAVLCRIVRDKVLIITRSGRRRWGVADTTWCGWPRAAWASALASDLAASALDLAASGRSMVVRKVATDSAAWAWAWAAPAFAASAWASAAPGTSAAWASASPGRKHDSRPVRARSSHAWCGGGKTAHTKIAAGKAPRAAGIRLRNPRTGSNRRTLCCPSTLTRRRYRACM